LKDSFGGIESDGMAKHEVGLEIDQLTFLGKVDIRIHVRSDGEYLGSLHISKGSLDWVAGRSTKYGRYRVGWERFAEMMESLTAKPLTTTGRRAPRKRQSQRRPKPPVATQALGAPLSTGRSSSTAA
jgi:hypothetical protein